MNNKKYYLIGEKLGHSFSKIIHESFGKYEYNLLELPPNEVETFMLKGDFGGINVTIPYKQTVMPYLSMVSSEAREIGAVNTVVNRDGILMGFNTDALGLEALILSSDISLKDKNVAILGTGGTGKTARFVANRLGASRIYTISRIASEEFLSYKELYDLQDISIIINTTPAGMYPNVDDSPLISGLKGLSLLEGVVDVIYNPITTRLVREAKEMGIKACNGLLMLVVQAMVAKGLFLEEIEDTEGFLVSGLLDEAKSMCRCLEGEITNK